jgi:hypothetical protein
MRLLIGTALALSLLALPGCDDIVDTVNGEYGAVEVENGTTHNLERLYYPPCGQGGDGQDRLSERGDLRPGDVIGLDLPPRCADFRAYFSDGRRRVITNVTPDADQRQRITFR